MKSFLRATTALTLLCAVTTPCVMAEELAKTSRPTKPVVKPPQPPSDTENLVAAAQVNSFDDLTVMAKHLRDRPMRPLADAPQELKSLSYNDYITIRYRNGAAFWQKSKSPFLMETFHQGFVQKDRIDLFVQTPQGNEWVQFDPERFYYNDVQLPEDQLQKAAQAAGHAGVKLIERIDEDDLQEIVTFLGASYFRARSRDTFYGTSARGLAVDVAMPKDEEFPRFRTFWIRRPFPGDESITVMSILDSPACTGAYQFNITSGDETTTVNVRAEIFPRPGQSERKFAIAPLTSMWMWGDGLRGPSLDNRPQVHDSSALMIQSNDEPPIFRPLARIAYPSVSRYPVQSLVGFGLVQRNRNPKDYKDTNANYQSRPTVIITPSESWDDGVIELFEIPGAHEGVDNIAAYWIPPKMPAEGEPLELNYRIDFTSHDADWVAEAKSPRWAKIESFDVTRNGPQIRLTSHLISDSLIDVDAEKIVMQIVTVRGEVTEQNIDRISQDQIDASVTIVPTEDAPTEITIRFEIDGEPMAETLSYLCPQREPEFVFPAIYTKSE